MASAVPDARPGGGKRWPEDEVSAEDAAPYKKEKLDSVAADGHDGKAAEDWSGATAVEAGWDSMAWLSEDGGRRMRRLEAIADADLKAAENGSTLLLRPREGAAAGAPWAELCARAMCALRTGQAIDVAELPEGMAGSVSVVDVPREEAKPYILGKAGARLLQHSEELDAIAVFGQAPANQALQVGSLIEAKYEGKERWFEAKVIDVGKTTVRVKWTYDDDVPESDVPRDDIRMPPQQERAREVSAVEVGALVDAKFGGKDRLFEAIVLGVGDTTVKVKWTYDDEVPPSEVPKSDVKPKPKIATDKLYIFGPDRGRRDLELKVLTLIESRLPGFVSSRPVTSDEGPGVGLSIVPLLNGGELKAKVIGRGGSVRQKIGRACGATVEYIGNMAFVVGTGQERTYTANLLDLVQRSTNSAADEVPSALEAICTHVLVPQEASPMVTGKQRVAMNQLEEETGTLTFWGPPLSASPGKAKMQLNEGKLVEGRFKSKWFEATILEITESDNGDRSAKVRWEYDENETSVLPVSDIREVPDGRPAAEAGEQRVLVVFGPERSRKLAELRIMATVELKCPGTCTGVPVKDAATGDGLQHEVLQSNEEAQRCKESRWRAAATAAHCLVERVGDALHLAGTTAECALARDYITWLAMAKPSVPEAPSRTDVTELCVPSDKRQNLAEHAVAPIEQETDTVIFFDGAATDPGGDAKLLVCGHDDAKRATAVAKLREQQDKAPPPQPAAETAGYGDAAVPKVQYVVSKEEEERRQKRAERFGVPPAKRR